MTKFEYKTIEIKPQSIWTTEIKLELIDQKLCEMGNEGWELVSTIQRTSDGGSAVMMFIFKRLAQF